MDIRRLETAQRHVRDGLRIVESQREIIERLQAIGLKTLAAEALLATFERSQAYLNKTWPTLWGRMGWLTAFILTGGSLATNSGQRLTTTARMSSVIAFPSRTAR